jgi:hypothetical protein
VCSSDLGPAKRVLSDHPGYLVRYRLSWNGATLAAYRPTPSVKVSPHKMGVKVSWTR